MYYFVFERADVKSTLYIITVLHFVSSFMEVTLIAFHLVRHDIKRTAALMNSSKMYKYKGNSVNVPVIKGNIYFKFMPPGELQ